MDIYTKIRDCLHESNLGILLDTWLRSIGFVHLAHVLRGGHRYKVDMTKIKEFSDYFSQNEESFYEVRNILKDEHSKLVWDGVINYRKTGEYNFIRNIQTYPPYFPKDIIELDKDEVFVDVGAYKGETSLEFIYQTKNQFEKIYMFEPNNNNLASISKLKNNNITVIPCGAYSKKTQMCFIADEGDASRISDKGETVIECNSLDNILCEKRVTFIKMDIEGAELEALRGAEQIIKNQKPKLAISIYHNPEDFCTIPLFLKELCPQYNFFVRHHSDMFSDTVLYCTI